MERNCLIVGASGEIGMAVAKRLATEGYVLLLHYNENYQPIEELLNDLPEESVLQVIKADLRNSSGIKTFLRKINFSIGNVVFASGKGHYGLLQDTTEKVMDEMFHMHVKSPWMISKHVIPDMVKNKFGNIVLISSIWGDIGASCEVVYSSVKGAQNSFVKSLAKEVGGSGISVNGVSPGFIDTKMNDIFSNDEKQSIIDEIPLNRAGQTMEVAHVVSFLLDQRSNYVQGEIIKVTGAW